MPINVAYQPNAFALGQAGYLAAQAIEQKRQQDLAFQQQLELARMRQQSANASRHAALQAQQQQSQQNLAAQQLFNNQLNRQFDNYVNMQELALRQDANNYHWAAQDRLARQNEKQMELQAGNLDLANRKFLFDQGEPERRMQRQQAEEKYSNEVFAAKSIGEEVNNVRKDLASKKYLPEGQAVYSDLLGKLRAIQSSQGEIRPGEYAKKLAQWLQEVESSGIRKLEQKPPTVEQELQLRSKDLGNGYSAVLQPNGQIQYLKNMEPSKGKSIKNTMTFNEFYSAPENEAEKKKAFKDAKDYLRDQYKLSHPDSARAEGYEPPLEDIVKQMHKAYTEEVRLNDMLSVYPSDKGPSASMPEPAQPPQAPAKPKPQITVDSVRVIKPGQPSAPPQLAQPPVDDLSLGKPNMSPPPGPTMGEQAHSIVSADLDRERTAHEAAQRAFEKELDRVGNMPAAKMLNQEIRRIDKVGDWKRYITPEAVEALRRSGSRDPVHDLVMLQMQTLRAARLRKETTPEQVKAAQESIYGDIPSVKDFQGKDIPYGTIYRDLDGNIRKRTGNRSAGPHSPEIPYM